MKRLTIVTSLLGLMPLTAMAQDYTAAEQALYDAAKAEGEVIWYTSQFTTEMSEEACGLFTARYPGITCSPVRATGNVTFQRVMQEIEADFVQGDLFSTNDQSDMEELKRVEGIMAFMPANTGAMTPALQEMNDPDGYYFVSSISPYGIAYNTNLVSAEEAPTSWEDLLDPKWQNKIAIPHPGFSGSAGLWILGMVDAYGWDYLDRLNALDPQVGRSASDGYNLIVSGERAIAATPSATAVLTGAQHPNAAKLFAEFMLTPEYSQWLSDKRRQPLLAEIPTAEGIAALADVPVIVIPRDQAQNGLVEAVDRFRDVFGI